MHVFYDPYFQGQDGSLSGEEFQHCVKVLRQQQGDQINLVNGQGLKALATIKSISKRALDYQIEVVEKSEPKNFSTHLLIAPTKNTDRIEWMVEKLAELQVDKITFFQSTNSVRKKLNTARLEKKVISALKQSKGSYKTHVEDVIPWSQVLSEINANTVIAYVDKELPYITKAISPQQEIKILIGPEGDFTPLEVKEALDKGAKTISLGKSTLRTETAGLFVCQAVNLINEY